MRNVRQALLFSMFIFCISGSRTAEESTPRTVTEIQELLFFPKGSQNVARPLQQQRPQILIPLRGPIGS